MVQKIDWKQAKKAIDALYTFNESKQSNDLLDSDEESGIYIQITTHKIMNKETTKKKKIALPCKPFKDDLEICYFTKENTKDVEEKVKDTPIKKVINTRELATVYKSFESRRKLLNSYDLFMVDDRIVHLMPPLLGKKFFERNKTPIALKPTGSFKNHIEAALNATYVKHSLVGGWGLSLLDLFILVILACPRKTY
ncbi:ribosomal protein L1p/L10e family-domain-containing protein [Mycotypha africana]|uniref:ribosomal protein L1p/L10e family-domain-containing protein n=1 Tax=Mycotypha africana TaxID=64632 RepID=UPI002301BA40|nr:ribosomal protein L1p/L10e family-domain-containing protein [Mycotypha africana]KAI8967246.1 ribosomal protein L1p/L10e family-domain-containing protein [Mycotypha africana]